MSRKTAGLRVLSIWRRDSFYSADTPVCLNRSGVDTGQRSAYVLIMAASTKLNAQRQAAICEALSKGASWSAAAQCAGISERTLHHWRERGATARSGKYRAFVEATEDAIASGEAIASDVVFRSFTEASVETHEKYLDDGLVERRTVERPPSADMALRWLERRLPERWSPRQRLAIGGDADAPPVSTADTGDWASALRHATTTELRALAALRTALAARDKRPSETRSVIKAVGTG